MFISQEFFTAKITADIRFSCWFGRRHKDKLLKLVKKEKKINPKKESRNVWKIVVASKVRKHAN
jgi:hypothetical protein